MRSVPALSVAAAACAALMAPTSSAFTSPSSPIVLGSTPSRTQTRIGSITAPILLHARGNGDDAFDELIPSLKFLKEQPPMEETPSLRRRVKTAGRRVWQRMDTMRAAGLYDDESGVVPMQSGFKSSCGMLFAAFMFKWYRARFINKIPVWDRQPQWNMVVTSPEQEKELHAYSCKQCGSTIFIARHREWFFKGGNTECTNCGAKGIENFEDIRGEVIDSIDDDYFDYESPLDFVSAAERRKLVKQAGGDEELAKKLAIENVMKNDSEQISGEQSDSSSGGGGESDGSSEKKKSAPKKKKEEPADIFDELDDLM